MSASSGCTAKTPGTLDRSRFELAFEEEFDRPPSFWNARTDPNGHWKTNYHFSVQETAAPKGWESRTLAPNQEMQYYGDTALRIDSFERNRGALTIVGKPNPLRSLPITNGLPYRSGLITTEKSFAQATGYFEARIEIPSGMGIWPAFWLLPTPRIRNGWSVASGTQEIDIFESIGEPGKIYFTYFPDRADGQKMGKQMQHQTDLDLTQYHTFGLLLTDKEIVWHLDDHEVQRVPNVILIAASICC